jgi:hypothetical protein
MKLRHIFENQTKIRIKNEKHALDLLTPWFTITPIESKPTVEVEIYQDKVHVIRGDLTQKSNVKLDRMPFEIDYVIGNLRLSDIKNLDNLPARPSMLTFNNYQQTNFSRMENTDFNYLRINNCANLTNLEGINTNPSSRFAVIEIFNCEQLAFDPWQYRDRYEFRFHNSIPRNLKLVPLICLSKRLDYFTFPWYEIPKDLKEIMGKYRGDRAGMIPMARELINANYEHHVR